MNSRSNKSFRLLWPARLEALDDRLPFPALTADRFRPLISVMTETTVKSDHLPAAVERFVVAWGEMGEVWGVNRSVSQIHALLYVSDRPLTAEDIADRLKLARSNVSTSLRELMAWSLIRRVSALGDRRDFYEAEADVFEMVRRIAANRKAREIDPAIAALRQCLAAAEGDAAVSNEARKRFRAMLDFTQGVARSFDEVLELPTPVLAKLIKMGGAVARLAGLTSGRRSKRQPDTD
jgi:DNA-binding transcriptional regulator GbsR (MarR family)